MSRRILINTTPWETRVALVDDNTLLELQMERPTDRGIAGNIYKGKVVRVLPGMQAAFLDIGLEKAAFLHVSDLVSPDAPPAADDEDGDEDAAEDEPLPARPPRDPRPIEERLGKGQELMVQVAKEPIGSKGARVTAHVSLPGRHLVFMPGTRHIGISRRIESAEERDRLRSIVEAERPPEGGLIVRTACEGESKREIAGDVRFLTRLWERIRRNAAAASAPALIHTDLDLVLRTVRDLFTTEVDHLIADTPDEHARVLDFVSTLMPRLAQRVELHQEPTPLFEAYGVEAKIARALDRRVWLKSGGYLIFEQTESLTTIDVNTGRYVGKRDQEETVLRTNLEAARLIVQQLRLRNIGGIIVIDFIDMEEPENRAKVFDALQEAVRRDKARSNVLRISEMGLVQMTRKRTRASLEKLLTSPCTDCHGTGRIRGVETIAFDALRAVLTAARRKDADTLSLRVHPEVAAFLRDQAARHVEEAERLIGRPLAIRVDESIRREQFDVATS